MRPYFMKYLFFTANRLCWIRCVNLGCIGSYDPGRGNARIGQWKRGNRWLRLSDLRMRQWRRQAKSEYRHALCTFCKYSKTRISAHAWDPAMMCTYPGFTVIAIGYAFNGTKIRLHLLYV
jgi:hypothetical protein